MYMYLASLPTLKGGKTVFTSCYDHNLKHLRVFQINVTTHEACSSSTQLQDNLHVSYSKMYICTVKNYVIKSRSDGCSTLK